MGTAHLVQLTDDSAYLWFFSPTNVEASSSTAFTPVQDTDFLACGDP